MYGVPPPWHEFLLVLAAALGAALVVAALPRPHWPSPAQTGAGCLWDAAYVVAFALALAQLAGLALLRHASFHSQALDLGSLAQVAWNTSQGRWFESSVIPTTANLLAEHFAPIFLLLAPVYRVFPDPRLLLFLQAAGLALGSLPLYLLARRRLGRPLGLALAAAFLLSPPLLYLDLADFHEIALAVPLLSGALYFLAGRRWVPMAVCLAATLLLREEMGLGVAAFGLWVVLALHPSVPSPAHAGEGMVRQGRIGVRRLWGVALLVLGLVWTLGVVLVVIPAVRGGTPYPYLDRYAYLGADLAGMLATPLLRPIEVVGTLATPERLDFVTRLLLPWGLLPMLSLHLLLALPTFAYTLLSQNPAQWDIQSQYHAPLVPIFAFAALAALERLGGLRARRAAATFLLTAAAGSYLLHGPGLFARGFDGEQYRSTERTELLEGMLARIPPDAGVATQTNLVPHLTARQHLYLLTWVRDWSAVEYVLLDRRGNRYPLDDDEYERLEVDLRTQGRFERVAEADDVVLYRRGS
ncbi:MAG: DUF2079 domain-containing protein [Chloroflexi bacterium]|nr:DUF2079 domain-containing protein [Chloroflexota bacterium]